MFGFRSRALLTSPVMFSVSLDAEGRDFRAHSYFFSFLSSFLLFFIVGGVE